MTPSILQTYLTSLRTTASAPAATETSFAPALQNLIDSAATHLTRPVAQITLQPGHVVEAGAPDIVVYGPTVTDLIGYVETKDLGKDLHNLAGHDLDQFNRYLAGLPIWILTNYIEFILYEHGEETQRITLCTRGDITGTASLSGLARAKSNELGTLLDRFLQQSVPIVTDAEVLATLLAKKARILEEAFLRLLEKTPPDAQLSSQLEAYRRWLIVDLTAAKFSDFSAQTLTYGLFFAAYENRRRTPALAFDRARLLDLLPPTIHPVRAIFQLLAAHLLPDELNWIIDDLMQLLTKADMSAVAAQLGFSRDPTVHFYETFLRQYDPDLRERLGVYYTPDEVVGYIVRSINHVLGKHFNRPDGLASSDVTLLDPALGTGTFLVHAFRQVAQNFGPTHAGNVPEHLRNHTLDKFYGFELLAAPYVLAHLKLGQVLSSLGVPQAQPKIFLTNTLADHQFPPTLPGPFEQAISEDGRAAQRVKAEEKILVVIGNPPYSGTSYNIYQKVNDYRCPDERARNWLQNDYVKFIRWAEWKIAEAEDAGYRHGVIGLITDHSYLPAPSFRCMRRHLLERFSKIYILNLHGNSRVREVLPPGVAVDENVFDIQQGTAIAIMIREAGWEGQTEVYYADLWGDRQSKYAYLSAHDTASTTWTRLHPEPPLYLFVPRQLPNLSGEYQRWPSIPQLMPLSSQAIVTARDDFVIDFDRSALISRIVEFAKATGTEDQIGERFGIRNTREFNIMDAKGKVAEKVIHTDAATGEEKTVEDAFIPILYRPFDTRSIYYHSVVLEWPREQVMKHLLAGDNLALAAFRHTRRSTRIRAFVGRSIMDARLLSSESNCDVFPLYRVIGDTAAGQTTVSIGEGTGREPNLGLGILTALRDAFGQAVTPEEVFFYAYGVLNAPGYLAEFEALLQDDYPRIPFSADYEAFIEMSRLGQRVASLHLLEAADLRGLANLRVGFPVTGSNVVQRVKFQPADQRVYINRSQYFEGVTEEMWNYRAGAYNTLDRWLRYRRGRTLTANDLLHYETFATAIAKVLSEAASLDAAWHAIRNAGWVPLL